MIGKKQSIFFHYLKKKAYHLHQFFLNLYLDIAIKLEKFDEIENILG